MRVTSIIIAVRTFNITFPADGYAMAPRLQQQVICSSKIRELTKNWCISMWTLTDINKSCKKLIKYLSLFCTAVDNGSFELIDDCRAYPEVAAGLVHQATWCSPWSWLPCWTPHTHSLSPSHLGLPRRMGMAIIYTYAQGNNFPKFFILLIPVYYNTCFLGLCFFQTFKRSKCDPSRLIAMYTMIRLRFQRGCL